MNKGTMKSKWMSLSGWWLKKTRRKRGERACLLGMKGKRLGIACGLDASCSFDLLVMNYFFPFDDLDLYSIDPVWCVIKS